jgi:hypothetical protein
LWFSFADLSRIEFESGHRFPAPAHAIQKARSFLEITHQGLCPDRARVVLTLGRMMFQFEPAGNGEGLENRVFACICAVLRTC